MQSTNLGCFVNAMLVLVCAGGLVVAEPGAAAEPSSIVAADGYVLRQVVSNGATIASNGVTGLSGTLGQAFIGAQVNDGSTLFQGFWFGGQLSCCAGRVGDANGDGNDEPNISDISAIVDHMFISEKPLPCYAEADANQTGGRYADPRDISVGDIAALVDYLFVTGPGRGLPPCK
jgi:hypothetical protein